MTRIRYNQIPGDRPVHSYSPTNVFGPRLRTFREAEVDVTESWQTLDFGAVTTNQFETNTSGDQLVEWDATNKKFVFNHPGEYYNYLFKAWLRFTASNRTPVLVGLIPVLIARAATNGGEVDIDYRYKIPRPSENGGEIFFPFPSTNGFTHLVSIPSDMDTESTDIFDPIYSDDADALTTWGLQVQIKTTNDARDPKLEEVIGLWMPLN